MREIKRSVILAFFAMIFFLTLQAKGDTAESLRGQNDQLKEIADKLESAARECREAVKGRPNVVCNVERGEIIMSPAEAEEIAREIKKDVERAEEVPFELDFGGRSTFRGEGVSPYKPATYSKTCLENKGCEDQYSFNRGKCTGRSHVKDLLVCLSKAWNQNYHCKESCREPDDPSLPQEPSEEDLTPPSPPKNLFLTP